MTDWELVASDMESVCQLMSEQFPGEADQLADDDDHEMMRLESTDEFETCRSETKAAAAAPADSVEMQLAETTHVEVAEQQQVRCDLNDLSIITDAEQPQLESCKSDAAAEVDDCDEVDVMTQTQSAECDRNDTEAPEVEEQEQEEDDDEKANAGEEATMQVSASERNNASTQHSSPDDAAQETASQAKVNDSGRLHTTHRTARQ